MEVVTVLDDAQLLVPNPPHKNFTTLTNEYIPKGTKIKGEEKTVNGLKRGEPYIYRLFYTDKGQIIYLSKTKPKKEKNKMEATDVKLGANGASQPINVNLKPAEYFSRVKLIGAGAGIAVGYFYAHKKGKNKMKWAAVGGALGYVVAYVIDSRHSATVSKK